MKVTKFIDLMWRDLTQEQLVKGCSIRNCTRTANLAEDKGNRQ